MGQMIITGKVVKYGDHINTDDIIPGRYLHIYDPGELAKYTMSDLDPEFPDKMKDSSILVAGKNFGCGSSREQAAICLKSSGVQAIVAKSFARIFFRNAINQGIPLLIADTDSISTNDQLELVPEEGVIRNLTSGITLSSDKLPQFLMELLLDGGLIPHFQKKHA